ncbi:MAG: hypothetical protein CBB99_05800 [Bacteroidetes bacterium TMED39]|nr:MAG: hypothetical protein CBB99_05800 [Bacteroidetes bacterium TMED39]
MVKNISQQDLYDRISALKLHHVLFWMLYFLFWYFLNKNSNGETFALFNAIKLVVYHGAASYFNIYVLLPQFLKKKLYFSYFISLFMLISLISFLVIITYYFVDFIPDQTKSSLWSQRFFVFNAISVSYTVAVTSSLKLVKNWYDREQQAKNLEKLNIEAELKYLKSQINPHFLFNSLNGVYALALQKDSKTPEMILKLSEMLRHLLYSGNHEWVSLEEEIDYLKNYLSFEKFRLKDRLEVKFSILGDIRNKKIAPMLFLPFVENAFKHGVNKQTKASLIEGKIKVDDNKLNFQLENNIAKILTKSDNNSGGIGLQNIQKRLKLMYPTSSTLEIENQKDKFTVKFSIDLNENQVFSRR